MGIYDRDYYRREGPSFLDALTSSDKVCKWLIIVNVACFVLQMLSPSFTELLILDPRKVMEGEVWRLVTHAFLHSLQNPWHILFNMLALWWFGRDVEVVYGSWEFLAFYLVAALLGGVAYTAASLAGFGGGLALGASGAVTAALVVCACHFPSRQILVMFVLPMPIWLFVVLFVALDAFGLLSRNDRGVAVAAHLGGAAFGYLYYKLQVRILTLFSWLRFLRLSRPRPRLRVYREEPAGPVRATKAPPVNDVDEHLEAKLDALLEKVARQGRSSLTESENQFLLRASEEYKKRRT